MKFKSESTGLELEVGEPTRAQQRKLSSALRGMYLKMGQANVEPEMLERYIDRVFDLTMEIADCAEQFPDDILAGDEKNIADELSGIYTEAMHSKKKQD